MSGINEFNDIQPEQIDSTGPDSRTGRKLLFSAVATALVITVAAAFGFTMNIMKFKDDPYGILLEQVANEINLNEQQKTEVNKIKETVTAKTEGRTIKHVKGGSEIEKLFRGESFDRQKALHIANRQEEGNRDLALFMVDELEKLHNVLTSEQRNSAVDKVKDLHAKFKSMNGGNKQKSKSR